MFPTIFWKLPEEHCSQKVSLIMRKQPAIFNSRFPLTLVLTPVFTFPIGVLAGTRGTTRLPINSSLRKIVNSVRKLFFGTKKLEKVVMSPFSTLK